MLNYMNISTLELILIMFLNFKKKLLTTGPMCILFEKKIKLEDIIEMYFYII